jgi:DNA-binding LytR/AlgR family response regulator
MRTIIIEDEEFAARRLENLIQECDPTIEIVAMLQSVKESVAWFKNNPHPDLIFLDIQLEDDLSFAIFEQVSVHSKIIFTTAFDEYAIKAFKLNSIDYLLKPINREELSTAIQKYKNWNGENRLVINPADLRKLLSESKPDYRERFMVTVGDKLKTIMVSDIAYFFSTAGITFVVMQSKNQYSLDFSLDNLKEMLNPKDFFRVNRQFFIGLKSVEKVVVYPKSRLKVVLNPPTDADLFVSIDKAPEFKQWLDGSNN